MGSRGVVFWGLDGTLGFGPHGPGAWLLFLVEALDELHPGHSVTVDELRPFTRGRYPWLPARGRSRDREIAARLDGL